VCAEPVPAASSPEAAPSASHDPASAQLVEKHDHQCATERATLMQAGVALAGSAAAVALASPTTLGVLPSLAAFVANSIGFGKAAAELEVCERSR
jgi:hypothetical protein